MDRRRSLLAASQTGGDFKPIIDINNYLTIEALEDGLTASLSVNACEYCVDGDGNWIDLPAGTATESINAGQTLSFKISNSTATQEVGGLEDPGGPVSLDGPDGPDGPGGSGSIGTFSITKYCNLLGNVMSMIFGDDAANNTSLSGYNSVFENLFYDCDTIKTVSNNFLPATFLSSRCYCGMFQNCTSLTTAPELPATTLAGSCYESMFKGCASLTSAPELPATTLVSYCYNYMFIGCTKLNYIKMLATDISAYSCLEYWVRNVSSTGTFVKNPAMTTLPTAKSSNRYIGIPRGWTVQNATS